MKISNLLKNIREFGKYNAFEVMLLAISEVIIFTVSNFITVLLPQAHKFLSISESEISYVLSIYGGLVLLFMVPSGILADKFSNKKLTISGLLLSIPFLLWFAVLVQLGKRAPFLLGQYILIVIFWSASTSLLFWTSMQRLISQKATKENQGTVYGLQGVVNGCFSTLFVFGIGFLTIHLSEIYESKNFFAYFIYFNCSLMLIISLLIWKFVHEKKSDTLETSENVIVKIVKNLHVWKLSLGVMAIVIYINILGFYLKDTLNATFQISASLVALLAGIRFFFIRFFASFFGKLADKFRSFILTNSILLLIAGLSLLPFVFLPGFGAEPKKELNPQYFETLRWVFAITFVLTGVIGWMMYTIQWNQILEIPRPSRSYGTTISFISLISNTSRAFLLPIVGFFVDKYEMKEGVGSGTFTPWFVYQWIIIGGGIFCLVGALILYQVYYSNKKELKRLGKTNFRWRELDNY